METTAKEWLEREVKRLARQAQDITNLAEGENRSLTDDERLKIEGIIGDTSELKVQIAGIDDNRRLLDAVEAASSFGQGEPTAAPGDAKTLGEAFVRSDGYRGLKARGLTGSFTSGPVEFGTKVGDGGTPPATVVVNSGMGGALPLQPQVLPTLGPVEEPLSIAGLFSQGTATQNSIVYLEETTTQTLLGNQPYSGQSSAATTTAQVGAKPSVFVDFTKRSTSIEKIAAFLPISEEMLEDEPQISSYINARLTVFVRQAEEAYLMNKLLGSGIATSSALTLLGISTANLFDQIAAGILQVQVGSGLQPDAVVIHPVDFWKMATTKSTASGDYFSGGPYSAPSRNPWGVSVVVTREAMLGNPLVGAFNDAATLFRKGGLSVEASNSHADYFRKNLTALRAEERLGLVVLRPAAFVKVSA